MHTNELTERMFDIWIDGKAGSLSTIFPDWHPWDRFGIVIHEAWGGLGASMLLQGAICEFYRARRALGISDIYPEVYAFHVGRDHGDMSIFDVWPFWKEVVVANEPGEVLIALADRGVTRLAVPHGNPVDAQSKFVWPEVILSKDKIRTVLAYSPDGVTPDADIEIRSSAALVSANTIDTLNAEEARKAFLHYTDPDVLRWMACMETRKNAVTAEETERARATHQAKKHGEAYVESFRRVSLDYAMARLVHE